MSSPLAKLLDEDHCEVELSGEDRRRLYLWMDCYTQISGSYSPDQADQLRELRTRLALLLTQPE